MENSPVLWMKYLERAVDELDMRTLDMFEKVDPGLSSIMLIELGKYLIQNDEWKKLEKQLRPKWYQFWKWGT